MKQGDNGESPLVLGKSVNALLGGFARFLDWPAPGTHAPGEKVKGIFVPLKPTLFPSDRVVPLLKSFKTVASADHGPVRVAIGGLECKRFGLLELISFHVVFGDVDL